jgi:hypothetical protein
MITSLYRLFSLLFSVNLSLIRIISKGSSMNPQKDVELLWNQPFFLLQEAVSTLLPIK